MRGLFNYYLSCCANTLLQTLNLMLAWGPKNGAQTCFYNFILRWKSAGVRAEDNVPFQLKRILKMMQEDLPHPAPHMDFLRCLDRNLSVQHDADEVFLSILDFIQRQMDDRTLVGIHSQIYHLIQKFINQFITQLTAYLLKDCMISFFEQQELRGIDCCFCAQCEAKTPTKQGVKLCSLPQILCIQLKRFRNIRGFTRKLNCRVTFPETFNFSEFQRETFSSHFTQQNDCRYTLYAVVVHYGDAMWGHYTAYVRHRVSNRWYYADDSHVSQSSWEDVQKTEGHHYR
uniref:USP domain-containing protein n=1 Tax=Xiphophorus couchianus TaxID=32473 RepID=A0A3B5M651_9TELE